MKTPPEKLFLHCLPRVTKKAFLSCMKMNFLETEQWYLAGGTAFTLQVGHRTSVDLDFFTEKKEITQFSVEQKLITTEQWTTTYKDHGTLYGTFGNAKMSFIAYPFFKPSKEKVQCGTVAMLLPQDIAAMKIVAVSQRGRKRDFVDLYWYCKNREPLENVLRRTIEQHVSELHIPHLLKSFTYFTDAENDPMPRIFFKATWKEIKQFFEKEAVRLAKQIF